MALPFRSGVEFAPDGFGTGQSDPKPWLAFVLATENGAWGDRDPNGPMPEVVTLVVQKEATRQEAEATAKRLYGDMCRYWQSESR